jgi:hypothetical protein
MLRLEHDLLNSLDPFVPASLTFSSEGIVPLGSPQLEPRVVYGVAARSVLEGYVAFGEVGVLRRISLDAFEGGTGRTAVLSYQLSTSFFSVTQNLVLIFVRADFLCNAPVFTTRFWRPISLQSRRIKSLTSRLGIWAKKHICRLVRYI